MGEIAFRVDPGCEFYEKYSQMRAEKQKFHDLAREFFNSIDPFESEKYVQCETFMMDLTEDEKKKYRNQILRRRASNGMCIFRAHSEMQKKWNSEVISKVNMDVLNSFRLWYASYINSGSCALWMSKSGVIYGYLHDRHKEEIVLPPYMKRIKISEYYTAKEQEDERT